MVRFLHTSDWQLGMTRHYLDEAAQGQFSQARLDAVTRMAELADDRDCAFVVVAGDVFDTNQPDRKTIGRALDALKSFTVPVYLLPGNHDAYDPGSVYRSPAFRDGCPSNVEVLTDREPRSPVDGVEVVGAPWSAKRPLVDLVSETCAVLEADGTTTVLVGHGTMDVVTGDFGEPGSIQLTDVETALAEGRASYVALGDRHSALPVGETGRIWYSGAPEPTSYREQGLGMALVVDLDENSPGPPRVEEVEVGRWSYHEVVRQVDGGEDLDELISGLDAIEDKQRAIVKVKVDGALTLDQAARLEEALEDKEVLFGALEHPERHKDITVVPDEGELADLPLTGYAAVARDRLLEKAAGEGDEAKAATDALALLVRLVGEAGR
ncbi:exonuclease SbcCD subunit D [soil metagenome]